jgi:hypothetical protein
MPSQSEIQSFDVKGVIVGKSEKGVLVQRAQWIPRSQIESFTYAENGETTSEVREGQKITKIALPYWLAKSLGLVDARKEKT